MKRIRRFLLFVLIILLAVGAWQIKSGYDKYEVALLMNPPEEVIEKLKEKENYTEYEDVPEIYFDALVAVEDRRFYEHNGFDVMGTGRAFLRNVREKKLLEGGSTITQQLVKNLYFPEDNTLKRKIAEVFMAIELEKRYSKKEILEFYINGIYYGSGYYSIYDASMGYFDKKPKRMSDYECTLLVGIPNAPSKYSPKVNPELAEKRQEKVVSSMVDVGYLTEDEAEEILEKND